MHPEVVRLLSYYVEPNPLNWLKLSLVSRDFYHTFTSDTLWKFCNPEGLDSDIYETICEHFSSGKEIHRVAFVKAWSGEFAGQTNCRYIQLGQAVYDQLHATSIPVLDEQFMWCALHFNGMAMKVAEASFMNNFDLAKLAVSQNGQALFFVSHELAENPEIARIAILNDREAIRHVGIRLATQNREFALDLIRADPEFTGYTFFTDDLEFMKTAVGIDGRCLMYASSRLQDNYELVMAAIEQNPIALRYASERHKYDKHLLLNCVKRQTALLAGVEHTHCVYENKEEGRIVQDDREIMMEAIKVHGIYIQMVSERLKSDPGILKEALKTYPDAHKYSYLKPESSCSIA